jgi:hypothetical protein
MNETLRPPPIISQETEQGPPVWGNQRPLSSNLNRGRVRGYFGQVCSRADDIAARMRRNETRSLSLAGVRVNAGTGQSESGTNVKCRLRQHCGSTCKVVGHSSNVATGSPANQTKIDDSGPQLPSRWGRFFERVQSIVVGRRPEPTGWQNCLTAAARVGRHILPRWISIIAGALRQIISRALRCLGAYDRTRRSTCDRTDHRAARSPRQKTAK